MTTGISAKHLYREAMEQVHTYNSKLLLDRRLRMPYIDNQTGLAQQDCHLWVSRVQRCAPLREGQIYSYPSRRWMVRKRPDFVGASKPTEQKKPPPAEGEDSNQEAIQQEGEKAAVEPTKVEDNTSTEVPAAVPMVGYEDFYDDDAFDSDFDSDEEFGARKKKRKTARSSRSNKKNMALKFGGAREDLYKPNPDDKKKFYDCQICNKRYKNQQSLRYHYEHHNHNLGETQAPSNGSELEASPQPITDRPPSDHVSGAKRKKGMPPSSYCDFCLGTVDINKKSGTSEQMVSCADCGRSGHPSCLQFNDNLTEQVKKYKWQCIECKCCCLCGTSDNDEQLLFCDDCDRGYHMYCLNPPIAEPPEGSWQCQLCEARVKGQDLTKVAVLPQHMDVGIVVPTSVTTSEPAPAPSNVSTMENVPSAQNVHGVPHTNTRPSGRSPGHSPHRSPARSPTRSPITRSPTHSPAHAPVSAPVHRPTHAPINAYVHGPSYAPGHPSGNAHLHGPTHGPEHGSAHGYLRGPTHGPGPGHAPGHGHKLGPMNPPGHGATHSPVSSHGYGPPHGSANVHGHGPTRASANMPPGHGPPHYGPPHSSFRPPGYPPNHSSVRSPVHTSAHAGGHAFMHARTQAPTRPPMNGNPFAPNLPPTHPLANSRGPANGPAPGLSHTQERATHSPFALSPPAPVTMPASSAAPLHQPPTATPPVPPLISSSASTAPPGPPTEPIESPLASPTMPMSGGDMGF